MKTIREYEVEAKEFTRQIPKNAKFLCVHEETPENVTMWFEVNPLEDTEQKKFLPLFTGEKFDISDKSYLGTFLMKSGMVFHLYEVHGERRS